MYAVNRVRMGDILCTERVCVACVRTLPISFIANVADMLYAIVAYVWGIVHSLCTSRKLLTINLRQE